jgi:hypothetical protein
MIALVPTNARQQAHTCRYVLEAASEKQARHNLNAGPVAYNGVPTMLLSRLAD